MTLFHAQTKYCAIWISCQKMQPQPASTTRKNICTNTDNYFKCYWTSFLLMPFASRYSSTRQLEGKTKIWLNEFFGWCRYCANIFYYEQLSLFLLYFRPLFITCYTTAHTASSSRGWLVQNWVSVKRGEDELQIPPISHPSFQALQLNCEQKD